MPYKRLMVIIDIISILLLLVNCNKSENSLVSAFDSKGIPDDLEKELPNEERIPTH